jgi:hypothetical protein
MRTYFIKLLSLLLLFLFISSVFAGNAGINPIASGVIVFPAGDSSYNKPEPAVDSIHLNDPNQFPAEVPPECINLREVTLSMVYPDEARKEDIEGKVIIKVLIGTDGNVIETGEITGPVVFYTEV